MAHEVGKNIPKTQQLFPTNDDGEELYEIDETLSSILHQFGAPLTRYAKNLYGEFYPIKLTDGGKFTDVIIGNRYAELSNGEKMYPLDENGNEFILEIMTNFMFDEQKSFPNSYPITNDNYIIVPNIQDKPYFLKNEDPKLTEEDIVGKLFNQSKKYHDYLTKVRTSRISRSAPKEYKYLNLKRNKIYRRKPPSLEKPKDIPPEPSLKSKPSLEKPKKNPPKPSLELPKENPPKPLSPKEKKSGNSRIFIIIAIVLFLIVSIPILYFKYFSFR
ncbi:hypothetical protein AVEN_34104-1 [Araneus ventricosus]|uniref:Uncharacterized protein n=1 Tax=Araneus ventricosus TaxID=182803 RepID=A0A4Y2W6R8_ARAVE|nr:hypothetical protein AVEN_34104-1 [Araneus ventricosus]